MCKKGNIPLKCREEIRTWKYLHDYEEDSHTNNSQTDFYRDCFPDIIDQL